MIAWNKGAETVIVQEQNIQDIIINWQTKVVLLTYRDDAWRKFEGCSLTEMEALSIMFGAKAVEMPKEKEEVKEGVKPELKMHKPKKQLPPPPPPPDNAPKPIMEVK